MNRLKDKKNINLQAKGLKIKDIVVYDTSYGIVKSGKEVFTMMDCCGACLDRFG